MADTSALPAVITAAAALLGAVIGSFIGPLWKHRVERAGIAGAFRAEIGGLILILHARGYISTLDDELAVAVAGGDIHFSTFSITENYFRIYEANVEKIGILDATLATEIPTFYTLLFAALEDIKDMQAAGWGTLNKDEAIRTVKELIALAATAEETGIEIIRTVENNYLQSWWRRVFGLKFPESESFVRGMGETPLYMQRKPWSTRPEKIGD